MTRRLVNKLLHQPVTVLRQAAARGRGSPYTRAVCDLFGIDEVDGAPRRARRGAKSREE